MLQAAASAGGSPAEIHRVIVAAVIGAIRMPVRKCPEVSHALSSPGTLSMTKRPSGYLGRKQYH